jgi:hypothetical protein
MARTSMTIEAADAFALEKIGPRGNLNTMSRATVDERNAVRAVVRRWLNARGFPAIFTNKVTIRQLDDIYNDTSDRALDKLRQEYELAKLESDELDGSDGDSQESAPPPPKPVATGADATFTTLVTSIVETVASRTVNADQVRAIVVEELDKRPSSHLVVKIADVSRDLGDEPRHYLFPQILALVANNIPVFLVGPPGSGKSTVCEQIARALDLEYRFQAAMNGLHDVVGFLDGHGDYKSTPARDAYEHGKFLCADELDTSDAAAIKQGLNTAIANGHMAYPDRVEPVCRHVNFRLVACANTWGTGTDRMFCGATQLDASTIDRFAQIEFPYDETLEFRCAGNDQWVHRVQKIRAAVFAEKARVVVSPRASINGAKMISAGWSFEQCESAFIWRGIDADLRRRIEARI